jgi:hypothetical protein
MGRKRQKQIKLCQWHVKAIGKPGGPGRSSGRHVAGLCRWPRLSAKLVVCRRSDGTAIGKGHGVGRRLPWASFANGRDLPMVCRRQIIEFADGCFLPIAVLSAKNDFAHGMSLRMTGPSAKYFCRWLRALPSAKAVFYLPMAYSLAIGKHGSRRQISRFR